MGLIKATKKPRMRFKHGVWYCTGGGMTSGSITPERALAAWIHIMIDRYDRERTTNRRK